MLNLASVGFVNAPGGCLQRHDGQQIGFAFCAPVVVVKRNNQQAAAASPRLLAALGNYAIRSSDDRNIRLDKCKKKQQLRGFFSVIFWLCSNSLSVIMP
jgi:hypothetical protein